MTAEPAFKPADPSRFSTRPPAISVERATRLAQALARDGAQPAEVREILNAYGFDLQPVLKVIEGGRSSG